eukprot:1160517-Pelagomonas_calceolata.AAC.9
MQTSGMYTWLIMTCEGTRPGQQLEAAKRQHADLSRHLQPFGAKVVKRKAKDAGTELRKQRWKEVLGLLKKFLAHSDEDREGCRCTVQVFKCKALKRKEEMQLLSLDHRGKLLKTFKGQSSKAKAPSVSTQAPTGPSSSPYLPLPFPCT